MSNLPALQGGLVFVAGEHAMTNSQIVAQCFGKQHKDVLRAIYNLECSQEFSQRNFAPISSQDSYGREQPAYEMTRDGFMFLAMGFTGSEAALWKEKLISAFNAMEDQIRAQRAPAIDLNDPKQLRKLLTDYSERAEQLTAQIEDMRPSVAALDRIANTEGSLAIRDAAKTLQVNPTVLTRWLETHSWIYRRHGVQYPIAYQTRIIAGLMEHKTHIVHRQDGSELVVTQPRITPKGLAQLAKAFDKGA